MKEVLFLRHAKSSWEYAVADRDRPLQPKGIHAIKAVAKHWKAKFTSYEAIFSSPANRALHTATLFCIRNWLSFFAALSQRRLVQF